MKDECGIMTKKLSTCVSDLQMRETGRERERKNDGEGFQRESAHARERKSILCPQPHTTLLSMLRGQSSDEPTTLTREAEEGGREESKYEKRKAGERVD